MRGTNAPDRGNVLSGENRRMFLKNKNRPAQPAKAAAAPVEEETVEGPTIIRPELTIFGEVRSEGAVQVYGKIEGTVVGRAVNIGEGAIMRGPVAAETLHISGEVDGPVKAPTVIIGKTAHVVGTITHHTLSVEPGAIVDGRAPWRPKADWEQDLV